MRRRPDKFNRAWAFSMLVIAAIVVVVGSAIDVVLWRFR